MRFPKNILPLCCLLLSGPSALAELPTAGPPPFPVAIQVNAAAPEGALAPIWRFFGADEPNYAYMKDGKQLLLELGQLGQPQVYFRTHHLLTSGDGAYALKFGSTSAYKEDADGTPRYDWTINDRIFDTYLERGVMPYVQIGFMPEALSSHPQDYPHHLPKDEVSAVDGGQAYPPKDYAKWGELSYQWAKHCIARYGATQVQQWYWEVWNEPNIVYWHGTRAEYFQLYDYAVDGVRRALPTARVGGPEVAGGPGGSFLQEFLEHCARGKNAVSGQTGSPLDFISFHAKGTTTFVDGHVRMGMSSQLKNMRDAFAVIASFPEYQHTPIVIGESDPEGCAACRKPSTAYRNGAMYAVYTAASFPRAMDLAQAQGVNLEGALTWAFEFEDQPPFAGFRQIASAGIDLPVLNTFRMFGQMTGRRLAVQSSSQSDADAICAHDVRAAPDVSALASVGPRRLTVLVWHYHDDDVPGPAAAVEVTVSGLPPAAAEARLTHYRIDETHSNAFTAWQVMGSPAIPTAEQHRQLVAAGHLAQLEGPARATAVGGVTKLKFLLPREAVSLLVLEWD